MNIHDDSEKVDAESHSLFRSGVGMLLYLVKSAVGEEAKAVDRPTKTQIRSFYYLIRYVIIKTPTILDW
jgi:hypothetical protein